MKQIIIWVLTLICINSYGQSTGNSYEDISCQPDWKNESYGVASISIPIAFDSVSYGNGSLVMTTDYSYKPYFLTSFRADAGYQGTECKSR